MAAQGSSPAVIVNPRPKTEFQLTPQYVQSHRALIERDDLRRSLKFALLEYQTQLCEQARDGNTAAAAHFRLMGANEFINAFLLLGEMPKPVIVERTANLNHST